MGPRDDKLKKSEWIRRVIDFVFGFKNKRGEILDHWIYSVEAFSLSPATFYSLVEKKLATHNIPGMIVARQEFSEGGLLSEARMYLHLMRERLAIDACAAPFGDQVYFFSCRTVHIPALVRLWHILAAFVFLGMGWVVLFFLLGFTFACVAQVTLLFAIVGVLRNAGTSAFDDLDSMLFELPVISTIYENWFRMETYYRVDTRELYLKLLPQFIREVAEEICAEKGVKLVQQHGVPPIMRELTRPLPPRSEPPK